MAVFSADGVQTIPPGEDAVFTILVEPDPQRYIRHRLGTGGFLLSGASPCRCKNPSYDVKFGGNIAIATGGTVGQISMALTLDGSIVPASEMIVTPAAVEEYFNISRCMSIDVWAGCCETITVRNNSDQTILLQDPLISISRN